MGSKVLQNEFVLVEASPNMKIQMQQLFNCRRQKVLQGCHG